MANLADLEATYKLILTGNVSYLSLKTLVLTEWTISANKKADAATFAKYKPASPMQNKAYGGGTRVMPMGIH